MKITVTKKPHAEVELSGVVEASLITKEKEGAILRAMREVEIAGFRKGKAPRDIVLREVGEKALWRDAAEEALKELLAEIFKDNAVLPILPPSLSLSVSDAETDVPFTITAITQPTVEVKDAKKIAGGALKALPALDPEKEKADATKAIQTQVDQMLGRTMESPALTDEEAKKAGFENVAALNYFLESEALRAVEQYDDQRKRSAVAEALLKAATIEVPMVIIRDEASGMLESTKQHIASQGIPFNQYLEKRGVTEADIIEEMLPQAEKRVSLDLIFAKIAQEEKIVPDDEETHRLAHVLERQGVPSDRAHSYAAEVSVREKIWEHFGIVKPKLKEEKKVGEHSDDHTHESHAH